MRGRDENLDWEGLMFKLEDLGVKQIKVEYSGEGDSGQIDETFFENKEGEDLIQEISESIVDFVHDYCYDHILNTDIIEDWINNEGGRGTVKIQVPSGEYTVENNIRIEQYETYNHEGMLKGGER